MITFLGLIVFATIIAIGAADRQAGLSLLQRPGTGSAAPSRPEPAQRDSPRSQDS
jgi:hypothetical protein